MVDPNYEVNSACNWFFLMAATVLLTIIGTIITEKIIEPRLGKYTGDVKVETDFRLSEQENRALKRANLSLLIVLIALIALCIPQNSFLRDADTGSLITGPLLSGVSVIISIIFFIVGVTYGYSSGLFKSHRDVCKQMGVTMSTMGSYLALAVVASQFIKYFNYTGHRNDDLRFRRKLAVQHQRQPHRPGYLLHRVLRSDESAHGFRYCKMDVACADFHPDAHEDRHVPRIGPGGLSYCGFLHQPDQPGHGISRCYDRVLPEISEGCRYWYGVVFDASVLRYVPCYVDDSSDRFHAYRHSSGAWRCVLPWLRLRRCHFARCLKQRISKTGKLQSLVQKTVGLYGRRFLHDAAALGLKR